MRQLLIVLLVLCFVPGGLAQAGSAVQTTTLTLTSAQILSLYTLPVQVVPAPGAGQIINPIAFTLQYKFGTVAYTVPPQGIQFISGTPSHDEYVGVSTANLLDAPSSRVTTATASGQVGGDPAVYANQPLLVALSNSDPTGGDGTLTITVTYTVVALQ
jgi:hypothetical protein